MGGVGVLITRSLPGAKASAGRLIQNGYTPYIDPVLEIHSSQQTPPDLQNIQAVIATSANGVRAFLGQYKHCTLPLFCLSGASKDEASGGQYAGKIHTVPGNAQDLLALALKRLSPKNGPLLWVRGHHAAFDMEAALIKAGYAVQMWEAYAAWPTSALSEETQRAFTEGRINAVFFHSARGANGFARLARQSGVSLHHSVAIAISPEAAAPLQNCGFTKLHCAPAPSETAMHALLKTLIVPL
jgi:uroporphyrinogen-III synthase